ncbi:MAG: hypothetical protein J6C37_06260, partial [Roseburia sp.]|nr:hypothetical protein [Roseburia sp.]
MEWKLAYSADEKCSGKEICSIAEIKAAGFETLRAEVPGNFELDLMREGKLEDLYFSTNTLKAQELEATHVWYYTVVNVEKKNQYLRFEGIDTFADIYVNGKLVKSTNNMYLPYDVHADWVIGENEVVVHIRPTMLEARSYVSPAGCNAQKYNYPSLYARKAAHMFGWDIMPRIVSAGIWRDVILCDVKPDCINEVYFATNKVDVAGAKADLRFYINTSLSGQFAKDYTVRIEGHCGESSFVKEETLWHNTHAFGFCIKNCKFWWPKNAGEANLYDTTVTLRKGGEVCDTYRLRVGVRTVELDRTEYTDKDGNGEFCFKVNGKKIFALGTNWVPLDAFHSKDRNRLEQALAMLSDIGCNMVRCWGGNVYESDEFFDYCDAHGIMIWQDFAMGCAVYPQEKDFMEQLELEAVYQIKRLRNHTALVLWAGDNEDDLACYSWNGFKRNPNHNILTRELLPRLVEMHDYTRPFLPSSPYMSESVFQGKGILPEEHLWGPRDYFKGDFYKNTFCHFASETGYHGFPSTVSLKKFLKEPEIIFKEDGGPTDEYLVHSASMETSPDAPYAYRTRLAYNQVVTLFGKAEENLADFIRQSQISQAEAKKYFIEKFRIGKWKRTGIIWWNLVDGWPQVSDAIVDYYFTKKLAYHYIKRSQKPVCLMFDEPVENMITLFGVNDLPQDCRISYTVKKILPGEEPQVVLSGQAELGADSSTEIGKLAIGENEK